MRANAEDSHHINAYSNRREPAPTLALRSSLSASLSLNQSGYVTNLRSSQGFCFTWKCPVSSASSLPLPELSIGAQEISEPPNLPGG